MGDKNFLVIVNPVAGNGKYLQRVNRIKSEFSNRGISYDLFYTSGNQKADLLIQSISRKDKYSDLVIVGGDGTINEAINGIGSWKIPISIISLGTGNDTVKHLQSRYDFESQIKAMFEGKIMIVDAGICNGRLFLNGVGIGFDGKVVEQMNKKGKKFGGYISYLSEVLRILLNYREQRICATLDGNEIQEEILLMTITKGTTFGGGFKINPFAMNDDGLLDICMVGKISNLIRLIYVLNMKNGAHRRLDQVRFFKSKEVIIDENPFLVAHMDGELIGQPPFEIKILSKSIQIRV